MLEQIPARFVTLFFPLERKVRFGFVKPSATVPRTVAFNGSNLAVLVSPKRKSTPNGVLFLLQVPVTFELPHRCSKNLYAHKNTIFSFASFDKCDTSKAILLKYSNLLTRQSAIFPQLQCQPFVLIRRAYSFIQLHRFHTPKHLPVTNRDQTLCKIGENFRVVFQVIIKPQKCGN